MLTNSSPTQLSIKIQFPWTRAHPGLCVDDTPGQSGYFGLSSQRKRADEERLCFTTLSRFSLL